MNETDLLHLKDEIEKAKSTLSELKGRRQGIVETLEKKYECKTQKQAERKLEKLKEEITTLEKKKQQGIKELEDNYELS